MISSLILAAAWGVSAPVLAAPMQLYVAPNGSDGWAGTRPEPNPGRTNGPFATLGRAQAEVRKLNAAGRLRAGATVFVRAGTYEFSQTFTLGPEDSGTAEHPIVYREYEGERPVLTGSVAVRGWKQYKGRIMSANLAGTALERVVFHQLFFAGKRMVLARYPNRDESDPHSGTWAHVAAIERKGVRNRFTATKDVVKDWTKVRYGRVCIHPAYGWAWNIIPLKAADRAGATITLARNVSYDIRVGDRYFVENLPEELDAPGEWYLDRDTATLYFWPPGESGQAAVRAPIAQTLIHMKGAKHVVLRGFVIEACDGPAVRIEDSEGCMVAKSVIRNCRGWGVHVSGGRKSGAKGNDICWTGAGGVLVQGGDRKTLEPAGNFATNNYIHHVAEFQRTYCGGVRMAGVGNVASHNLIHDCYHQGITLGGNDNVVEYNVIHHTNLGSEDTGGLYTSSRDYSQRGSVVRHNVFHHIGGFGKASSWTPVKNGRVKFEYPHFTWGIYLDAPETGVHVYGNVLYRVPVCGMFNHSGKDNTWENNIVVDCPAFRASTWGKQKLFNTSWTRFKQVQQWGALPLYLERYPELRRYDEKEARPNTMFNCRFVRNIVYYTSDGGAWMRERNKASWQGSQLLWTYRGHKDDFGEFAFDHNTVFAPASVELKVECTLSPGPRKLLSWDEWRGLGKDAHSQFADPLFVDPAKHDYRLRPDSPALRLGFQPIPFDRIGPVADELRASWPVVEAPGAAALGDFTTERYFQLPGREPEPAAEVAVRSGAGRFLAKLAAGQSVTVSCFAGGNHQQGGWIGEVAKSLRQRYPTATIHAIDASICGCVRGSAFSVYRFRHEVLRHRPDLVFIDFSADDKDATAEAIWRAAEGMVRQGLGADEPPDLVFVHAFRAGYEGAYRKGLCPTAVSAHEKLARHYGLPSINLGVRITQMAEDGRLLIRASAEDAKQHKDKMVFTHDGVYATPAAKGLYAKIITEALPRMADAPTAEPRAMPPPFQRDHFARASLWPLTQDMLAGKWTKLPANSIAGKDFSRHFDAVWLTTAPGSKITFRFKGTAASLFDLIGPDTGSVRVTVDGQDKGVRRRMDRWMYYQRLSALSLASGLDEGVHTVSVELLPDAPDRTVPMEEAKKLERYRPEDFKGTALRVGWLRLVGELVE